MSKGKQLDPAAVQRDLERFSAAVKESERAEREARRRSEAARAQGRVLDDAERELQAAVEAVRVAKRAGKGQAEADTRWRAAKARVIELETGAAPSWAPKVSEVQTAGESAPQEEFPAGEEGAERPGPDSSVTD